MSHLEIITIASGVLQFGVACYALRLNRLFGPARVGWSLFSAFIMLAVVHLFLSSKVFQGNLELSLTVDIVYGMVAVLLLTGMAHLEKTMKRRLAEERAKQQAESALEAAKARQDLQQVADKLQTEVADRRRIQGEMEKAHKELMSVSRQAGMSEVATGVLHNVGNVLNSVNVSASLVADHISQLKIAGIGRAAELLKENAADIGNFMANDSRGQQLPAYLAQVAQYLANEQAALLKEIEFVKKKIDHIKEIVNTQQNYGRVSALTEKVAVTELVEDVLRIHSGELAQHKVELQREYSRDLPEIIVDKHKVLQILLNLITNAKHACVESPRADKRVTVRVTNGADRVRISMSDNGVGIPPANLTKIFNHGFTTRKQGGHGFGLHSGALAAKEMGGVLTAHSDGPGKGSTFTLELPLQPKGVKA